MPAKDLIARPWVYAFFDAKIYAENITYYGSNSDPKIYLQTSSVIARLKQLTSSVLLANITSMLRFFQRIPRIGLELTQTAVRLAVVLADRGHAFFGMQSADLPPGVMPEEYSSACIGDNNALAEAVWTCMDSLGVRTPARISIGLPDGLFRIQILDFDEMPSRRTEQEQLIRWRIEKQSAFDISDALLRFQVMRRLEKGFTVIACAVKRALIEQCETVVRSLGAEPWEIAPSSFHTSNLYASYAGARFSVYALSIVSRSSLATIVIDQGMPAFYRYKELKRLGGQDFGSRLIREIDDSIHFYTHCDRSQSHIPNIDRLFLAGEQVVLSGLANELAHRLPFETEALLPSAVVSVRATKDILPDFSAAIGAGMVL